MRTYEFSACTTRSDPRTRFTNSYWQSVVAIKYNVERLFRLIYYTTAGRKTFYTMRILTYFIYFFYYGVGKNEKHEVVR